MQFIWFLITNFLAGFVFVFIFSLVVGLVMLPFGFLAQKSKALLFALLPIAVFLQGFVILWWAAYLVERTIFVTAKESVTYDWLYAIAAFLSATAPLRYMAGKERQADIADGEVSTRKDIGQFAYIALAAVGFLFFYFYPPAMNFLYGWFLHWWFGV